MRKLLVALLFMVSHYLEAMSWSLPNFRDEAYIVSFVPDEVTKETILVIKCNKSSFTELPQKFQKLFKKNNETFVYSSSENYYEKSDFLDDSESYKNIDRLVVLNEKPKEISIKQLAEIIKNKKVIFYTGAGISAGCVPTMNELMKNLGISKDLEDRNNLQTYIENVIQQQKFYINIMQDFFDKCKNAPPSDAHIVMAQIVSKKNQLIITENLDQLHQKTGIIPIVIVGCDVCSLNEAIQSTMRNTDFIITVGLNSDESGLLKFYKNINPGGKIVSINLRNTNYLSDDDMLVVGDIQNVFKQLKTFLDID